MESIINTLGSARELADHMAGDRHLIEAVERAARTMAGAFQKDHKVLFCGNGGSAADAQHLAAELSGRFYIDRPALFAEALHVNTSYLTAVANDYAYDLVYERLVQAKGRAGDVLVGISTSGNSRNILKALTYANTIGMDTIGMTGADGGSMQTCCSCLIVVPSRDTARVQEAHILVGHILCEIVEKTLFGPLNGPRS